MAPRRIQAAVKQANVAEKRDQNLMIHGIQEEDCEDLKIRVAPVLKNLDEVPLFTVAPRLGEKGRLINFLILALRL